MIDAGARNLIDVLEDLCIDHTLANKSLQPVAVNRMLTGCVKSQLIVLITSLQLRDSCANVGVLEYLLDARSLLVVFLEESFDQFLEASADR